MYWYTIGRPISISILYTIPDSELEYFVLSQNLSFGIIYHLRACTGIFWAKLGLKTSLKAVTPDVWSDTARHCSEQAQNWAPQQLYYVA